MVSFKRRIQDHLLDCRLEVKTSIFWRDVCAEVVATFFLLAVQSTVDLKWGRPDVFGGRLIDGLTMGMAVTVLIEVFGSIGGAHMNPAVSFSMVVAGQLTILKACIYTIAQCIGAIGGSFLVKGLTPAAYRERLAATTVHPELEVWQGLLAEIWVTMWLLFAIHGASNDERHPVYMNSVVIGFAVVVGSNTGAYRTGASMNPARSLGPAVAQGIWEDHWIYWVGPFVGGITATLLYFRVFDRIGSYTAADDVDVSGGIASGIKSMTTFATTMADVPTVNPTATTAPFSRRQAKVQAADLRKRAIRKEEMKKGVNRRTGNGEPSTLREKREHGMGNGNTQTSHFNKGFEMS